MFRPGKIKQKVSVLSTYVLTLLIAGCSSGGTGAYEVGTVTVVSVSDVWSPWEVDQIRLDDPEGHVPFNLRAGSGVYPMTFGWVDVPQEEWLTENFHASQLDMLEAVANKVKELNGVEARVSLAKPKEAVLQIKLPKEIGDNYILLRRYKRLRTEAKVSLTRPDGSDDMVRVVFHSPCAGKSGEYRLVQELAVFRLDSYDQEVTINDVLNGIEIFSASEQTDVELAEFNSLSAYGGKPFEEEVNAFSFKTIRRSQERILLMRR